MSKPSLVVAALVIAAALAIATARGAEGPKPGETLDQTTWQEAESLLPPEILRHYRDGEYRNPVADWPESKYNWPPDFQAATRANEGKLTVGPRGEILSKETGKQPPYVLGHPFPAIDPSDRTAGVKVVWNQFYRFWYFGNLRAESQVNWISPGGLERRTDQDVRFAYYDGVPEDERMPNPQNFLTQALILVKAPADLHGTAALTWRYRDADRRDSTWTYVPALRGVRAVSPTNRSDGFLGSDMSQDDGPFFDGKPEDFRWTYVGEAEMLCLYDRAAVIEGAHDIRPLPGGGWRAVFPPRPRFGWQDPRAGVVAWAPLAERTVLVRRPV